ncbi:MAG: hypothetical protein FJ296_00570 [Planctomycetes bacterium]|nr:hypothetical protein [Planctomycetota bacterium]
MNDRGTFPWRPALAASALLGLSLLTVNLRAGVVREGQDLMRREHVRQSLERHARDLQLRLQQSAQELGGAAPAAGEGQRGAKKGAQRP